MSERLVVDLFVEDSAHEKLLVPLVERVGREEEVDLKVGVRNAQGGRPGAVRAFQGYQVLREKGLAGTALPDVLVVAIDGNCATFAEKQKEIRRTTRPAFEHMIVAACPDPHIERWYVGDPRSFERVVGCRPRKAPARKCDRGVFKKILADAVASGGHPLLLGGVDFAAKLVEEMDLYRAGRTDQSFSAFVEDLRGMLRRASRGARSQ